ncbi:BnaC05g34650D [Brassica napus]|uniref:BnaC05g34650D protein n=1 Tax=Brassica napus TaxID=3708 RepID=A0A078GGM9_BRANA|nr:BnaC05g34650D [Brassica napus]
MLFRFEVWHHQVIMINEYWCEILILIDWWNFGNKYRYLRRIVKRIQG